MKQPPPGERLFPMKDNESAVRPKAKFLRGLMKNARGKLNFSTARRDCIVRLLRSGAPTRESLFTDSICLPAHRVLFY